MKTFLLSAAVVLTLATFAKAGNPTWNGYPVWPYVAPQNVRTFSAIKAPQFAPRNYFNPGNVNVQYNYFPFPAGPYVNQQNNSNGSNYSVIIRP